MSLNNQDDLNQFWDQFDDEFNSSRIRLMIEWSLSDIDIDGLPDMKIEPKYKKKLNASLYVKKNGNELF